MFHNYKMGTKGSKPEHITVHKSDPKFKTQSGPHIVHTHLSVVSKPNDTWMQNYKPPTMNPPQVWLTSDTGGQWIPCERVNRLELFIAGTTRDEQKVPAMKVYVRGISKEYFETFPSGYDHTRDCIKKKFIRDWTQMRKELYGLKVVDMDRGNYDEVPINSPVNDSTHKMKNAPKESTKPEPKPTSNPPKQEAVESKTVESPPASEPPSTTTTATDIFEFDPFSDEPDHPEDVALNQVVKVLKDPYSETH